MQIFLIIVVTIFLLSVLIMVMLELQGAPFVPSAPQDVQAMIHLAQIKKGERVVDLGSGDGTILIALAKQGIKCVGYELNPLLVLRSRRRIKQAGLSHVVNVRWKSFWDVPLGSYDVIFLYGIPHIMGRLEKKLLREDSSQREIRVISNYFQFPNLKPHTTDGRIKLYRIRRKA